MRERGEKERDRQMGREGTEIGREKHQGQKSLSVLLPLVTMSAFKRAETSLLDLCLRVAGVLESLLFKSLPNNFQP